MTMPIETAITLATDCLDDLADIFDGATVEAPYVMTTREAERVTELIEELRSLLVRVT